jgi:lysophospholipase L1-like esterase
VLVMIGVNDFWTSPDAGVRPAAGLRIARLLALLRVRLTSPIEADRNAYRQAPAGGGSEGARLLRPHLEAIAATARARGATPVLLTYPASRSLYGIASRRAREAGQAGGTRVVDVARAFEARCPGDACELLQPDAHPTAAGHRVVAETLVAERVIEGRW